MNRTRGAFALAGVVAGLAGLATSYFVAGAMSIRESPVVAVAELVIRLTPGALAESAIQAVGTADKPLLVIAILLIITGLFAVAGRLAERRYWASALVFAALAALAAVAVLTRRGSELTDAIPVAVGLVTWLVALSLLTEPLRKMARLEPRRAGQPGVDVGNAVQRDSSRRGFLIGAGVMAAAAGALGVIGRVLGGGRRRVEETRRLLRISEISEPLMPPDTRVEVDGVSSWMTPNEEFYRIDTTIGTPTIEPKEWTLRIHGLVEREVVITYDELVARQFTEGWITLNCVSNPVGGTLIGNAWWSGVRLADLLSEAGLDPSADAVLQTSEDGWTCGTPIEALTDDRNAMLAVGMNGKPLPIDHGFPVRTIVPGLYGYVSATKWVVDMEVTRFSDITAYWTERGWGELGPVKMSSRVEVPLSGQEVAAGPVTFAGTAWSQHTGIAGVEVAVDGGSWTPAELAGAPTDDCWVQWRAEVDVTQGDHLVRVRATDKEGLVQTGVERDVLPDGATGWHTIDFRAS
ncbi:MAG: molybdopterin-dependent oxidoreductase [Nocardioides sp.]